MPVVLNLTSLHDIAFFLFAHLLSYKIFACQKNWINEKKKNKLNKQTNKKQNCCLLGSEPEPQLHSHGSVLSSRLPAGQGGGTQFHAQAQGERQASYYVEASIHPYLIFDFSFMLVLRASFFHLSQTVGYILISTPGERRDRGFHSYSPSHGAPARSGDVAI